MLVEVLGGVALLQLAHVQHGHPVPHGHGLGLVVGHVEGGHPHPALDAGYLGPHLHPHLGVQVADSGSSIKNTDGSRTMARPMATLWRWPPDSWEGLRSR